MFIGHFVGAELLHDLAPRTPAWIALSGASFPDLLWGATIVTGIEKVEMDPNSPLQSKIRFVNYPFSHSLVLTNLIALVPALILTYFFGLAAGVVFVAASISHWLLDTIVHLPDLPILGFDGDRKVGLGLWRYGPIAWILEYVFFAVGTLLFVSRIHWPYVLVVGFILNLFNVNSAFGLTKTNPMKSGRVYAVFALVGFVAGIWLLQSSI